jgi:penicillin-insensitive murein endopeptidase
VDLLFYVTTPAGAPARSPGFVRFSGDTLAQLEPSDTFIRFDVERNWLLVKYLILAPRAQVQWLFVSRALEALLIDYARARGEDVALIWHAETLLLEPGDSTPHDDHFHLRVACTPEEAAAGCEGGGPYWEWLEPPRELGQFGPHDLDLIARDDPLQAGRGAW